MMDPGHVYCEILLAAKNRILLGIIAGPCDTWGHCLSCSRNIKLPSNNRACATSPSFPEKNLNTLVKFATMSGFTSWDDQATRVKGFRLNLGNKTTIRPCTNQTRKTSTNNKLVVSTQLKNISQNGNLPQVGVKIKNI